MRIRTDGSGHVSVPFDFSFSISSTKSMLRSNPIILLVVASELNFKTQESGQESKSSNTKSDDAQAVIHGLLAHLLCHRVILTITHSKSLYGL